MLHNNLAMRVLLGLALLTSGFLVAKLSAGEYDHYGAYSRPKMSSSGVRQAGQFSPGADLPPSAEANNLVNLYTGQHQQLVPLISVAGRNGSGTSVKLVYNGNVGETAIRRNHRVQASPFGLGFNIGVAAVFANNMGTIDIVRR